MRRPSESTSDYEYEPIVLEPYIERGLLKLVNLDTDTEKKMFINLALNLDDGEDASLAIAITRKMQVITDDKKAVRILYQNAPTLKCLSTLDIIKEWSETASIKSQEIKTALERIWRHANYRPGKNHHLFEWWNSILIGA